MEMGKGEQKEIPPEKSAEKSQETEGEKIINRGLGDQDNAEKIEQLELSREDAEKFSAVQNEAKEYIKGSEAISRSFLDIEGFSFDQKGADAIAHEMTRAFIRGRLKARAFPPDKIETALDILAPNRTNKAIQTENQETQKGEKVDQKILEKAYQQILEKKDEYIHTLEKLSSTDPFGEFKIRVGLGRLDNLAQKITGALMLKEAVEALSKILEKDLSDNFSSTLINDYENKLNDNIEFIESLRNISDEDFIDDFANISRKVEGTKEIFYDFFSKIEKISLFNEIMLIFSITTDGLQNHPELNEKIADKLKPLFDYLGLAEILPKENEEYDPRAHKIDGEEISKLERGKITRVLRPGIRKGDEAVTKAWVIVSKGKN